MEWIYLVIGLLFTRLSLIRRVLQFVEKMLEGDSKEDANLPSFDGTIRHYSTSQNYQYIGVRNSDVDKVNWKSIMDFEKGWNTAKISFEWHGTYLCNALTIETGLGQTRWIHCNKLNREIRKRKRMQVGLDALLRQIQLQKFVKKDEPQDYSWIVIWASQLNQMNSGLITDDSAVGQSLEAFIPKEFLLKGYSANVDVLQDEEIDG